MCKQWCTPMADYDDVPVCAKCDADHEAALIRLYTAPDMPHRWPIAARPLDDATRSDLREIVHLLAGLLEPA